MAIVAAIDRSDRADNVTREAEILAKAFDESVHVVHVLTRSEFVDLGVSRAEAGDAVDMEEVREAAADIASDAAGSLGVPFEVVGLMGNPAEQIVDYASDHDARYIVVAGRRRSPAGKAVFGSVAQSVLLNAEQPVLSTIVQRE